VRSPKPVPYFSLLPSKFSLLVGLIGLWIVLAGSEAGLNLTHGLTAEYFANAQFAGAPVLRTISPSISTAAVANDLDGQVPPQFSVRWFGYLTILRSGLYTFATSSDDGSRLSIDGQLVVNNGGIHGLETRTGRLQLNRGPHIVLIEYEQAGGPYAMDWSWARGSQSLSGVPEWLFSPGRSELWRVLAGRTLVFLRWAAAAAVVLVLGLLAWNTEAPRRYPRAAMLLLFIGLAILQTWPLATNPARLSRNDNADTLYNEWAMAWVAHQLPRAPFDLFNANIFYPEPHTLAYSESIIVQGVMAAPVLWLGGSPVLAYSLVLLAGFALTGWATCLVIARWTNDWVAGLTSGIIVGFNAHTLMRIPHMQAQHAEFLPLALLALDALLREPRLRHQIQLVVWFTLQALTSLHLMVFTALALTVSALVRPASWSGARFRIVAPRIGVAAIVAGAVLLPFVLPYVQVRAEQEFTRRLADVSMYSASWRDYVTTPGRFHYQWWSHNWTSGTGLFPGVVALLLAGLAIGRGVAFKDPRARMCLAFGVCGVVLSFGTNVPGYELLYRYIPILQGIRAVVRFGYLGIVAVGMLAGFGVVELRRRIPSRAWAPAAGVILILVNLEPLAAPLGLTRFAGISPIYSEVRTEPNAVVVEIPFYTSRSSFLNGRYMLNSTAHFKPMLNGYSGFVPGSYFRNVDRLQSFPSAESIAALRAQHVTHVFVHLRDVSAQRVQELAPELKQIATDGVVTLYRLEVE
jgi:hypothetical protein